MPLWDSEKRSDLVKIKQRSYKPSRSRLIVHPDHNDRVIWVQRFGFMECKWNLWTGEHWAWAPNKTQARNYWNGKAFEVYT